MSKKAAGFITIFAVRKRNKRFELIREGLTQQYIPLGALRDFTIPIPDNQQEQLGITSVLGALDDKIELNRRMNETLEALAQSLFKSWFVDATQSALPKGWREATLGEVAENASNTFDFSQVSDVVFVNTGDVLMPVTFSIPTAVQKLDCRDRPKKPFAKTMFCSAKSAPAIGGMLMWILILLDTSSPPSSW